MITELKDILKNVGTNTGTHWLSLDGHKNHLKASQNIYFVLHRRNSHIQVLNDMRMNNYDRFFNNSQLM